MIRLFLADDHQLIRRGLRKLLEAESDIVVAGEAATSAALVEQISGSPAQLLLLDLNMPGKPGLEVLRDVRALRPDIRILVLTMHPEDSLAVRTLRAGASGYLTKEAVDEELLRAIRKVAAGGKYLTPVLAERLAESLDVTGNRAPHELLSDREFQVLLLIAEGNTTAGIGRKLGLSPATINTYRARLLEKMGMASSAEVMHYAISHGLVRASR